MHYSLQEDFFITINTVEKTNIHLTGERNLSGFFISKRRRRSEWQKL